MEVFEAKGLTKRTLSETSEIQAIEDAISKRAIKGNNEYVFDSEIGVLLDRVYWYFSENGFRIRDFRTEVSAKVKNRLLITW